MRAARAPGYNGLRMPRALIVGSGREIPPNRVTNAMLARVMDTSDEWIR
jgi:3-oxoacyl-[acyl-carrier-protein] synthase III